MEGRVARATRYGHTFGLLVPESLIPEHERGDVLEVKVARVSEPAKEYALFTTHLPGYKRAYLDLFQLSASYREEFLIRSVRKYSVKEFMLGYNDVKSLRLENTELIWNGNIAMNVEGRVVELADARFRTYGGEVILDAELGEAGAVKIAKSLGGFVVRLKDHSLVTSIRASGESLLVVYQRTDHDDHPHTRGISNPVSSLTPRPAKEWLAGAIRVVSAPQGVEGRYGFETDSGLQIYAQSVLNATRNLDERRKTKGGLGEDILAYLLSIVGWTEILRHPLDANRESSGSSSFGPDSLAFRTTKGENYFFEFKWWNDTTDAEETARQQLEFYQLKELIDLYNLKGAYSGILEWNPGSRNGYFYLNRVW